MPVAWPERAVSEDRRPVVALVSDAIYPHFYGAKELRYHALARLAEHSWDAGTEHVAGVLHI
jgi:hypothetical protein